MSDPGHGLHGAQYGYEHPRACLLPHDEEPVWADGDAGIARLLPEGSAERSRQRAGHEADDLPPRCGSCHLVGCVRNGESGLCCRRLGRTPRLLTSKVPTFDHFHPQNLVRSSLALYFCRAHTPVYVLSQMP